MHDKKIKVILITGTSSGIGETCAHHLYNSGHKVYGASRSKSVSGQFDWIKMDVTKEEEVKSAVEFIIQKEGRIDVLINNAGINIAGAIEDLSGEQAKNQFETNFFGSLHLIRHVLPAMRTHNQGHIINVSSIGGMMGLPFQGMYCASKFALEGMTESLRLEIRNTGIQVTLVEPGDFSTPITHHRILNACSKYYSTRFERTMKVVEKDETSGSDPIMIAKLIQKLIHKKKLKTRYVSGKFPEQSAVFLKRILPSVLFEFILIKKYKL
jgi:NAD(P)-dependent dehydrogenase (short-subunit alcohol dehydrogenase family)